MKSYAVKFHSYWRLMIKTPSRFVLSRFKASDIQKALPTVKLVRHQHKMILWWVYCLVALNHVLPTVGNRTPVEWTFCSCVWRNLRHSKFGFVIFKLRQNAAGCALNVAINSKTNGLVYGLMFWLCWTSIYYI
jgi:hypothetical protein